jgi:putative tryptophan/tyrosine transport system substrate-binding protein
VRRRDLIALLGGAVTLRPFPARAQKGEQARRIGVLMGLAESDEEARSDISALKAGLKELGWSEDRNIAIDLRWGAGDSSRMRALAAELVGLHPDLLIGHTTGPTTALRQATDTIPIIFIQISDPIGSGFISSLAGPGGNLTGFSNYELSMGGKWLQLLTEIAPGLTRVGVLFNPRTAPYVPRYYLISLEAAAPRHRVELVTLPVESPAEIEEGIDKLAQQAGAGLAIMPDSFGLVHRDLIVGLTLKHKLPTISPYRDYIAVGGLLSYGVDIPDLFRRAADYVDRVFKGERPGDLPVQQPTKFELVINQKTATALGLTVPPALFAQADEVIE